MVDISIITVSTNELHYLKKMIASIKEYEDKQMFEIIVIDNASNDGTSDWLKENHPEVKIIRNRSKQGFSFNNNIGIKRSKGRYLLISNPDIIYINPILEEMKKQLENNPDIGIITPKLLNDDRTVQKSVRRFYNWETLFVRRTPFLKQLFLNSKINRKHVYSDKNKEKAFYPDWAIFAFIMLKRDLIEKCGFIDERFRLYFEDVDFCLRVWRSGLKVMYYPNCSIVHSYKRESDVNKFLQILNPARSANVHFKSMIKFLFKYRFRLGAMYGQPERNRIL